MSSSAAPIEPSTSPPFIALPFAPPVAFQLRVNGRTVDLLLEPRVTLLDALRESMQLTGTKKGCDRGQCGACTVLVDGQRINACLTLAIMQEGREIVTVEGLAHPLQEAFVTCDAFQCGYCTPGQICSGVALLGEFDRGEASSVTLREHGPDTVGSDADLRERMSGNLCRCGAYPNIIAAIRAVLNQRAEPPVENS
ncbi:MAG: 2Fe-2S iron-sulfur cluster-binding protein [Massilia sp.]